MIKEKRAFATLLCSLTLLTVGSLSLPLTASADPGEQLDRNLMGTYAYLFQGTVFLPAPFDGFNGPFFRMGQIIADGRGNMTVSYVANFNGSVSRGTFPATYVFTSANNFVITIPNTPIPGIPAGIPNVVTMDGVLADNGRVAKCVVSGVSLGGQTPPNLGSVITGEILKQ
jgi:hypothetical protein